MARIRSIHPGLFTDEAFMALCSDAQVFFLGLWGEADDQGVFEWKPLTLKVRLRGGKDGAVEALLEELQSVNCIMKYELAGRQYGAIRNFRKYQRPKKPNAVHPITDEIRTYVALTGASSEPTEVEGTPVPHQFPTSGEKSPQMEDGGWRMEEVVPFPKGNGRDAAQLPLGDTPKSPKDDPWREVYALGRRILGNSAGGVITNLRKTFEDKPRKVLAKLQDAAEQREPLPWINAFLWKHGPPGLEGIGAMDAAS